MRRSPFYAYPTFPHSFYAPPAEEVPRPPAEEAAYYHRPLRPYPPSSPAPAPPTPTPTPTPTGPRSVINIPVFESAPSCPQKHPSTPPPSSPPASPAPVPLIDPHSAATRIQSHFRGFSVRRHRPLFHLRSIAKARKQLEGLQSELESPGFPLKMRASGKDHLRFSESVMAIILSLDAIEGSMVEVRSQRKEATKMAIKLQDAIDGIILQRADLQQPTDGPSSDGATASGEDSVLCDESDVNTVQGGVRTILEESIMDVNPIQEESTSPEDDVADKCMSNVDNEDTVDDIVPPIKAEDVDQHFEAGMSKSCCLESAPQGKLVEVMHDAEQDMTPEDAEVMHDAEQVMTHVTGENAGDDTTHRAEEEVNNGIEALHVVAPNSHMLNNADEDTFVDDMNAANHHRAQEASFDRLYACMDVIQEVKEGLSQDVELRPGTPTVEEKYAHYSNAAHQNQLQGPSTPLEKLTEGNCSSDGKGSPTLHRHEYENCSDLAYENPSGVANSCNEANTQSSTLSMVETSPPDNALLLQLSEDCRQLRSLVGKLLVQNKVQSKVLCALGERLELVEQQQQFNCQQQTRENRKLRKGSKRSVKCRKC